MEPGRNGNIGATTHEFGGIYEEDFLKKYFAEKGFSKVVCYGMGDGLDAVREAAAAEKNIVVSPAGIAAAKYLQQKFGTPYELFCPPEIIPEWKEKKEQVANYFAACLLMRPNLSPSNSSIKSISEVSIQFIGVSKSRMLR